MIDIVYKSDIEQNLKTIKFVTTEIWTVLGILSGTGWGKQKISTNANSIINLYSLMKKNVFDFIKIKFVTAEIWTVLDILSEAGWGKQKIGISYSCRSTKLHFRQSGGQFIIIIFLSPQILFKRFKEFYETLSFLFRYFLEIWSISN